MLYAGQLRVSGQGLNLFMQKIMKALYTLTYRCVSIYYLLSDCGSEGWGVGESWILFLIPLCPFIINTHSLTTLPCGKVAYITTPKIPPVVYLQVSHIGKVGFIYWSL